MAMKRTVYILILCAGLIPVVAGAREETLEERKKRITRKYLRERAEMTYSEMYVPEAAVEAEELLDSEKFKQPQVDFQRQEGNSIMPRPPARRPAPRVENSNWLLSEEPKQNDPYANPFSDPFARKDSTDKTNTKPDWASWGNERDLTPYEKTQRGSNDPYGRYGATPANLQPEGYGSTQQGFFNSQDPRSRSAGTQSSGFQQGDSVWRSRSLFGQQQQEGVNPNSMDALDLSRDRTFNSTQAENRLSSPFSRETQSQSGTSAFGSRTQSGSGRYTPYKSSFQTDYEQRQQQQSGYGEAVQPQYQKQNTFQQWKERNPVRYDPTADDAYIQEMMPKSHR